MQWLCGPPHHDREPYIEGRFYWLEPLYCDPILFGNVSYEARSPSGPFDKISEGGGVMAPLSLPPTTPVAPLRKPLGYRGSHN